MKVHVLFAPEKHDGSFGALVFVVKEDGLLVQGMLDTLGFDCTELLECDLVPKLTEVSAMQSKRGKKKR
jgi:hypothetical protein